MNKPTKQLVTLGLGLMFAAPVTALAQTAACRAHGEAAFTAWTHNNYDKVGKDFSPEVAAKLTPAMLKQTWSTLQGEVGAFEKLGSFAPHMVGRRVVMVAPMTFSLMALDAVFTCDAKDRIAGIQIVNPRMVPGLKASAPASH